MTLYYHFDSGNVRGVGSISSADEIAVLREILKDANFQEISPIDFHFQQFFGIRKLREASPDVDLLAEQAPEECYPYFCSVCKEDLLDPLSDCPECGSRAE
jgi:hypothetical protein